jgi:hypothetical protein
MIFANFASLLPTDTSALEHSICALESSISTLESSIASLVGELPFWEYFGFVSAALVVIGVLLELHDIWDRHGEDKTAWAFSFFGVSKSPEKPRFIKKYGVELASVILVAGGVAGEVGAGLMIESKNAALRAIDIKLRSANSELRSKSDQLLAVITEEAGDAAKSAKSAHEELTAVKQEVTKLREQMEEAFASLNLLRSDVDPQLSRGVLLSRAAPKLKKVLAPFGKLKVVIFMSGPAKTDMQEVSNQLIGILGPHGVNWDFPRGPSPIATTSPSGNFPRASNTISASPLGPGLRIFVSTKATKQARDAARAFSVALAGTLPPAASPNVLVSVDPRTPAIDRPFGQEESDNPAKSALMYLDGIAIEISVHP